MFCDYGPQVLFPQPLFKYTYFLEILICGSLCEPNSLEKLTKALFTSLVKMKMKG